MRERERRVHWGVAASVALLASVAVQAAAATLPSEPRITGRSAVIIDASTGTVIWQRDADRQLPPASTTKVMTTLLALESGRLDRSFTVSPLAASQAPSKLGLRAGQTVELGDLTYALMLKSANDAAVVVAEGLAGSVEQFAVLMNRRAREVGATNTHFHNPNGLPDAEHVTTTHDMAMILRHALTVPGFREIAATSSRVIHVEDSKVHPITVRSRNRLLEGYFVTVLGKTGYTRAAGRCFAGEAELNGHKIITVVFGATDMWGDTRRLMEYGFSSYEDTAPLVQTALQQYRAKTPRAVASVHRHARRKTVVAKRSRRSAPRAEQEVVASAKPTQALSHAKSVAQTAAQTRSASAAIRGASRGSVSGRSADQHARLETGTTRTRR